MKAKVRVGIGNRTKIVATIGPASSTKRGISDLVKAGVDVFRVNFSHGSADDNLATISKIRDAASESGVPVAILQDLQGPKLRVGSLPDDGVELVEGLAATLLIGGKHSEDGAIPVPYEKLGDDLKPGDRILLNDGLMELEVGSIEKGRIVAKVVLGGRLRSNQGIAVPTAQLSVEGLTEKDRADLALGLKQGVDWVALSFVRQASDIEELRDLMRKILGSDENLPGIIAKIEKHEAIDNFSEILAAADGVMIARGDLGLETPLGTVPVVQKSMVAQSVVAGKPVIVATHMLSSMTMRPRPTRAEVSDVANAVLDHADAVMLSEETAMGSFPLRSVEAMTAIIDKTEEAELEGLLPDKSTVSETVPWATAAAAGLLAKQIGAKAILVTTRSGYSARAVARLRQTVPLIAATDDPLVLRQLSLSWGVTPILIDGYDKPEEMVMASIKELHARGIVKNDEKVVVVSGLRRGDEGYDSAVRVVAG